ncbi:MAG TPA: aldo/keto reductase [Microthrixaceae bacterium]|nr:aldo/keto reductase [Microthrixaceae bacterium]
MTNTWAIGGDLKVHRLGFGAMQITGEGVWGEPEDRSECLAVLRRAVDLGVDLIDTADAYGPNVSEELIAEALSPYPRHLVIATKAGLLRDGPSKWHPDGRPEHLRQAVEASLRRLRLDEIPLLQFHRPDPKVPIEESVGTLADLQSEGKIRHIGVCNVNDEQLSAAMAVANIVSVQNRYNVDDRHSESLIDRCETEQIAFFPWAPLGNGSWDRGEVPLRTIAKEHGATPNQVALAWLLARSPAVLPIPGTSSPKHLEENVTARDLNLTPEELLTLNHLFA